MFACYKIVVDVTLIAHYINTTARRRSNYRRNNMSRTETLASLSIERMEEFFVVLRTEDTFKVFGIATNFKAAKKLLAAIRRSPEAYGV